MAAPRPLAAAALGCAAVAGLSLLAPSTPTYDPWAWLVWGREVAALDLDTSAGPAWKPLPVAVTSALAPLGDAAPEAWLLLARASGLLALVLAWRVAARLAGGGGWAAGAAAVLGLAATVGFLRGVALGASEGALVALVLLAVDRHLDGRRGQAFAAGVGAALLRPEAWPLLLVYALLLRRVRAVPRAALAAGLAAVPLLWFLPELWGSGDLLRSSGRARIPEPGQPALAGRPALAVLEELSSLLVPVVAVGALATVAAAARSRDRIVLALAGGAAGWTALVAALSEAGFSGEGRYLLVPAALAAVLAGAGAGRLYAAARARWSPRVAAPAAGAALAAAALAGAPAAAGLARDLADAAELRDDLAAAVARAGGPEAVRSCGPLYAGRYRFPLVAWHVGAHISDLDLEPRAPGVVLRSRLTPTDPPEPGVPDGFRLVSRAGAWEVHASCARSR